MKLLKLLTVAWFLVPSLCFANPGMMLIAGGGVEAASPGGTSVTETFDSDTYWTTYNGTFNISGGIIASTSGTDTMMYYNNETMTSQNTHGCVNTTTLTNLNSSGGTVGIALRVTATGSWIYGFIKNQGGTFFIQGAAYQNGSFNQDSTPGPSGYEVSLPEDDAWICAEVSGAADYPTIKTWYFDDAPTSYSTWDSEARVAYSGTFTNDQSAHATGSYAGINGLSVGGTDITYWEAGDN